MSFSENFSIFSGGATAIGDGFLISNGVSQLNELDDYINSTGKTAESEEFVNDLEEFEEKQLAAAQSTIEIEGHTDNVPIHNAKFADNNELSSFRALSVFNYFMETTFLDPAMIKHSGRGEYLPVADNSTPEGRAQNRRVEIKIYHSLSVGE